MKHGKANRKTDLENMVHELNMLKKRVKDYEKLFSHLKHTNKMNRIYNNNLSIHLDRLEKQLEQCNCERR